MRSNRKKMETSEPVLKNLLIFSLYQIPWIFVINQVPCVSSCWGKTHTRGGEFPNSRSTKQQLQSDWLKFEIELNSLS